MAISISKVGAAAVGQTHRMLGTSPCLNLRCCLSDAEHPA